MSPTHLREQALPPGTVIDVYEIRRVIGLGGFGVTYEADDPTLGRRVAIKEYFPGSLALRGDDGRTISARSHDTGGYFEYGLRRFLDEARILAQFHDTHIVRVLRYVEANGTAYLIMDYEEGEPLQDYLRHQGPIDAEEVHRMMVPVLRGLRTIHENQYLHRDIKPANIFLRRDGTPLLLDFGSARQALEHQQRSMTVVLTPGYAPIEQYVAEHEQGPYSDLYSLGATMFKCLSGHQPPESTARLNAVHNDGDDPMQAMYEELRGRIAAEFVGVVEWLLEVRARDRPQSAQSVLVALERFDTGDTGQDYNAPTVMPDTVLFPVASDPPPRQLSLSEDQVQGIVTLLTEYLGPIARVLVKRAVSASTGVEELRWALAGEVENEADRDQFLTRVAAFLIRE